VIADLQLRDRNAVLLPVAAPHRDIPRPDRGQPRQAPPARRFAFASNNRPPSRKIVTPTATSR
jgi:hypothetical protein